MKKVNCVMIGDTGVGKTTITTQLTQSMFEEEYKPTVDDEATFPLVVNGSDVELTIYDTSGNPEFAQLREEKCKKGDGFIAVYSTINSESFNEIKAILDKLKTLKGTTFPIVLVGCKIDSSEPRQVTTEQGAEMAKNLNCPFAEISAKDRDSVVDIFTRLIHEVDKNVVTGKVATPQDSKPKKKKCCVVL